MDVKASARAKHASSQRGRARHSTPKQHPQQQQQQLQQAVSDLQPPPGKKDSQLPSNWSRYEEEEEEEEKRTHLDVPPVKSKGANYKDLLAEKSMLQGTPDLASGRKALMATRGLDLWSRISVMDNLWSVHEVSGEEDNFFTLDLDFLNKELAKLDIGQRLLLDPEYAHLAMREKSERECKIPEAETVDEDETILTLPSGASSMKSPTLASPQDTDGLYRSMSAGNEEPGGGGVLDPRLFKMPDASSNLTIDYAHSSFADKKAEKPDGDMQSVSKESLTRPSKPTNSFDAKSAEAELDALLDMLDNRTAGQASMPNHSLESARGPQSPISAFEGGFLDALQGSSQPDIHMDSSDAMTLRPHVEASNDSPLRVMGASHSEVNANNKALDVPHVDTRKIVPNPDEDFDEWLDSL